MAERIYLDNSATSWPKPPEVWNAVDRYQRTAGASAGRGGYAEARDAARLLHECRELMTQVLGGSDPSRVIFTANATGAINLALKGHLLPGDHVVTTEMEHNSVVRPLEALRERGIISLTRVACGEDGRVAPSAIARALTPQTRLIVLQHASNVSGTIQPVAEVCLLAREWGIPTLVDAAQSAGTLPIHADAWGAAFVAVPGHKGLLGPMGTGALYVAAGMTLRTVTEGGTGTRSELERQPDEWPDRHEGGAHNMPGIVGLSEALRYLLQQPVGAVAQHKATLFRRLHAGLSKIEGIRVLGPAAPELNIGIVSFTVRGWEPPEFAQELDRRHRVQGRPGLHCAPGAHRTLGSYPAGAVRLSIGPFNTLEQMDATNRAVAELAQERRPQLHADDESALISPASQVIA